MHRLATRVELCLVYTPNGTSGLLDRQGSEPTSVPRSLRHSSPAVQGLEQRFQLTACTSGIYRASEREQ